MIYLCASIVVLIFFSVLAFWKENGVMFMLSAGAAMVAGFNWFDVSGTTAGLGISLMLWAYSISCLVFAFMCIFKRRPKD